MGYNTDGKMDIQGYIQEVDEFGIRSYELGIQVETPADFF